MNLWIDLVKLTLPKPSEQYITIEITFPGTAYRGSTNHPNIQRISLPERHLPNWEPLVCSADISSVTESQTYMSLAFDVSLSSLSSIVDVPIASLRRQVLKCLCSFSESRCSQCEFACAHSHTRTMAIQSLGSWPTALLFVVCYQQETGRAKIFSLEGLQSFKVTFFSSCVGKVDGWC